MRAAPKTRQIVKWNGGGWDAVGSSDRGSITGLAVSAIGVPWIVHECAIAGANPYGRCIAHWDGEWVNAPIDKLRSVSHIAFDEEGVLWAGITQFETEVTFLHSFVTRRAGTWQHEFNSWLTVGPLAVRNGNPAVGQTTFDIAAPRNTNGWLVYPALSISNLMLSPNGTVWVGRSAQTATARAHRWLGGNTWSAPILGGPKAFDSNGDWVNWSLNLTGSQNRGAFALITRSHDETYFAATRAPKTSSTSRSIKQQVVYKVEGGRSTALGKPFRTISQLAVDAEGRPWVYAQTKTTSAPVASAIYRFEGGVWVPIAAPEGYDWLNNLRTGLDGSVVMTGGVKFVGRGTPVAMWRGEDWVVLEAPADISLLEATTDKEGFVWGIAREGRLVVQAGASNAASTRPVMKNAQIEKTVPSLGASPVSELDAAVEEPEVEVNVTPVKVSIKSVPETEAVQPVAVFKNDFVGCWAWSNGAMITVKKNGYATNGFAPGPWVTQGNQQYRIEWPDLVSSVNLAAGGTKMIEKNLFGESGGQRVSGATTGFSGSWLLDNGATAHADSNGNYTIGPLQGTWRSESGSNRFEIAWPLVDQITLATDGTSLSGANQFGRFTATKRASCK